ncbi:MAG: hydrolase, partial [Lachnospirales bacterium]
SRDKGGTISVTAYDQLRYLKNKDTYVYENMTANKLIEVMASSFGLICGTLEDTGFSISRVEENKSWFDIILSALEVTIMNTGKMYVLYDEFGEITLKNIENMKIPILIDNEVAENFDYSTSIDSETYNQVKLYYKNQLVHVEKDDSNIAKWGVLQLSETIEEITENALNKAKTMLEQYNSKTRTLTVKNVLGDTRVRAGCSIGIYLSLGDMVANQYMLVEKCTHTFKENEHYMDLTMWL